MFLRFARRTKIKDLQAGGDAVIEGTVIAEAQLKLPAGGKQCVYYDILNESFQRGARGAGRKLWMVTSGEQKLAGFYIEDDTGRIWIAAEGPEVDVSGAPVEAGYVGKKSTARFSARYLQAGFVVRARGRVDEPGRGEPNKVLVLRPGKKGRLTLLVRKTA